MFQFFLRKTSRKKYVESGRFCRQKTQNSSLSNGLLEVTDYRKEGEIFTINKAKRSEKRRLWSRIISGSSGKARELRVQKIQNYVPSRVAL